MLACGLLLFRSLKQTGLSRVWRRLMKVKIPVSPFNIHGLPFRIIYSMPEIRYIRQDFVFLQCGS